MNFSTSPPGPSLQIILPVLSFDNNTVITLKSLSQLPPVGDITLFISSPNPLVLQSISDFIDRNSNFIINVSLNLIFDESVYDCWNQVLICSSPTHVSFIGSGDLISPTFIAEFFRFQSSSLSDPEKNNICFIGIPYKGDSVNGFSAVPFSTHLSSIFTRMPFCHAGAIFPFHLYKHVSNYMSLKHLSDLVHVYLLKRLGMKIVSLDLPQVMFEVGTGLSTARQYSSQLLAEYLSACFYLQKSPHPLTLTRFILLSLYALLP